MPVMVNFMDLTGATVAMETFETEAEAQQAIDEHFKYLREEQAAIKAAEKRRPRRGRAEQPDPL